MSIVQLDNFKMIVETEMERYRADTLYTKEPETIAWINDMQPGEVLYDVGANIGIYTLYAASRGIQVVAIEPVLENFHRLVQNVELNGFDKVVPLYGAVAAYQQNTIPLAVKSRREGDSGSQIISASDYKPECVRHIPCYSLDDRFMPNFPPQFIKIDVDGMEIPIFSGMFKLFIWGNSLRSYLIELNTKENVESIKVMNTLVGFTHDNKYNTMTPHSRERRQREGITAENVVFTRIKE
jgi:FkbM family methyltransferase